MGEHKNVLYISYDGMTDPLGQSQVLPYISGLNKHGITFHLISFEKPARFKQNRDLERERFKKCFKKYKIKTATTYKYSNNI